MKSLFKISPWWAKVAGKIVLSRVPAGYSFWHSLGLFSHGHMDSDDYALKVFRSHVERAGFSDQLAGKTVLELGPGDSISTAVIAYAHGARTILIDAGNFANRNVDKYISLTEILANLGLSTPNLQGLRKISDILDKCGAIYLTEGLLSLQKINSESVDFVFSQAVLEHIRKHDFLATKIELSRILKSDGICSHRIDLKDHLSGGLNNLRFSESMWESKWMSKSGFYTNRIRYQEMCKIFEKAGFDVEVINTNRWAVLPTPRSVLKEHFKSLPDDDLLVSGFDVLLYKNSRNYS